MTEYHPLSNPLERIVQSASEGATAGAIQATLNEIAEHDRVCGSAGCVIPGLADLAKREAASSTQAEDAYDTIKREMGVAGSQGFAGIIQHLMQKEVPAPSTEEPSASSLELGWKNCRGDPSKLRFDLVPPEAEEAMAAVLTYGAGEYGERNWEKGLPWGELYGAVRRHMLKWMKGEDLDESGLPHLWHAFTSLGMLIAMVQRRPDLDTARNLQK